MKRSFLLLASVALCISTAMAQAVHQPTIGKTAIRLYNQPAHRTEIILPQVKGYNIYKGDFHIHTSYSDGVVNPAGRVTEAWLDGLDIIAITDHYEGHRGVKKFLKVTAPYNEDGQPTPYQSTSKVGSVKIDFNAIHDEAVEQLNKSGYPMLIIKGCEMGRNAKTHGHFNCLFLKDINGLYDKNLLVAFNRVHDQGGIVIHNHPGWRRNTTDKTEFHEEAYNAGLIDGVEVVNGVTFYPHIVKRCIDEKLTMFANTDIHSPSHYPRMSPNVFRTMTLVLAKDLTEESVKDAIVKRRTLAYVAGNVIGEEKWLVEFLNAAIDCRLISTKSGKNGKAHTYTLTNNSSIAIHLRRGGTTHVLEPFKTTTMSYSLNEKTGKVGKPKFTVENMWHVDYKHPVVELKIDK